MRFEKDTKDKDRRDETSGEAERSPNGLNLIVGLLQVPPASLSLGRPRHTRCSSGAAMAAAAQAWRGRPLLSPHALSSEGLTRSKKNLISR